MAMQNPNMHNLTTLIKRLEAATSRLEDLACSGSTDVSSSFTGSGSGILPSGSTASSIQTPPSPAPVTAVPAQSQAPPPPSEPPMIAGFNSILNNELKKYVEASAAIGGLVEQQGKAVEKCFQEQRRFLLVVSKSRKPDSSTAYFSEQLQRMQKEMMVVTELRESNRGSPLFNHLSVVSDGIPALAWVTYDDPPAFVNMMLEAAQFYGDKVLKQYKEQDVKHVHWVKAFRALLMSLQAYTKKFHNKSITWNENGMDAQEALQQADDASAQRIAAMGKDTASTTSSQPAGFNSSAPAPPPPPPLPQFDGPDSPSTPASSTASGIEGVFAQLNNPDVTKGLRKVDKSQMTHKNPSLRANSTVPARSDSTGSLRGKSPAPPSKPKPAHMKTKKPPRKELDGNKWIIENYENDDRISLDEDSVEINQSVLLFKNKNSTLRIQGKINALSLNECPKTNIVVDSLVSSIDIIKSPGFAIQVLGRVPTIQVDQCDGGTIYLGRESIGAEIFTSKTTGLNVLWQDEEGDEAEYVERPVPEQLKHVVGKGGLESSIVEHLG